MRKQLILLSLCLLALGACTLPGAVSRDDQVATLAAGMIESTIAAFTAEAQLTGLVPSSTPFPTATGFPTDIPPTQTFTPTVTPVPSQPPEDPRLHLGEPDWVDTFDSSAYWFTYNGSTSRAEIHDGAFYYTMFEAAFSADWTTASPRLRNFYLEVQATNPAVCSGHDHYGLFFRGPDPAQGYLLAFSCAGEYQLTYWDGSAFAFIINWAANENIHPGPNAVNRVGVRANGSTLEIYANGAKINGFSDNTYDSGLFGLLVGAAETDDFTVVFDEMAYWILP
jgi:hypothetical protein